MLTKKGRETIRNKMELEAENDIKDALVSQRSDFSEIEFPDCNVEQTC